MRNHVLLDNLQSNNLQPLSCEILLTSCRKFEIGLFISLAVVVLAGSVFAQEAQDETPKVKTEKMLREARAKLKELELDKAVRAEIDAATDKEPKLVGLLKEKESLDKEAKALLLRSNEVRKRIDEDPEVAAMKKVADEARSSYTKRRDEKLAADQEQVAIKASLEKVNLKRAETKAEIDVIKKDLSPRLKEARENVVELEKQFSELESGEKKAAEIKE